MDDLAVLPLFSGCAKPIAHGIHERLIVAGEQVGISNHFGYLMPIKAIQQMCL